MSALRDAAEIAYSEMAFAVQDLMTNYEGAWADRRAQKLAQVADELREALDSTDALDPVTLERAAEHVEYTQLHDEQDNNIAAAAIRSLKKEGGGG